MSQSDSYPHDISFDFLDPLLDTYHCDGALSPEEMKGYVSRSKMPHTLQFPSVHILPAKGNLGIV